VAGARRSAWQRERSALVVIVICIFKNANNG
jgi:hypothetical protein